ncbi:CgeB family protein [Christiangramia sabulilitoris]|uniref:Glycosyltransferase n=1 Tax=Christiangramia sabulilitoris TaxID=2583991 RepID=A0A550HZW6_9FLAO|nr:glycosyltransferase [Christiangramia sabulilitoris]TRO64273.1 glycosyltransferase [Christiangramia sabulilitoris]
MKIAIIGAISFDSLEYHVHDELIAQGHDAKIFSYKNLLPKKIDFGVSQISEKHVEKKNKKLLEEVLNYNPDLVIGIYRHIHPLVVKSIKKKEIKIIHINPDALTTFQNQQLFVEPYDVYFSKDPYMVSFMKNKLNLNVFQYQEAFNPRVHKKPNRSFKELEDETKIEVLCFGNLYPYRNRMLRLLKERNINVTMFGHQSKFFDPYLDENFQNRGIYGDEKAKILNGAKIVFNNFHYAEVESVNNKFFEITGSGAFQICDYKPILEDLLPIDPKLISFQSIDEAEEKIRYYLNEPEERWKIRNTLSVFFQENYTYKNMLKDIFSKL